MVHLVENDKQIQIACFVGLVPGMRTEQYDLNWIEMLHQATYDFVEIGKRRGCLDSHSFYCRVSEEV